MRIAILPTSSHWMSAMVSLQENTLEQISSLGHQMSPAGGQSQGKGGVPVQLAIMSRVPALELVEGGGVPEWWNPMYNGQWSHGTPPVEQND